MLALQLLCVYVEMDNEDVGKPVSDYFGVQGDAPRVSFPLVYVLHALLAELLIISKLRLECRFLHTQEMRTQGNFCWMVI